MPAALAEIKQQLDDHIGEPITLVTHESRHRTIEHEAVVRETFRSVFVLDLKQDGNVDHCFIQLHGYLDGQHRDHFRLKIVIPERQIVAQGFFVIIIQFPHPRHVI